MGSCCSGAMATIPQSIQQTRPLRRPCLEVIKGMGGRREGGVENGMVFCVQEI